VRRRSVRCARRDLGATWVPVSIERVSVKGVERAGALLSHLRHHRTRIAEGLRRTAARNIQHWTRMDGQEPRLGSASTEAKSRRQERVWARVLSDQGLENTPVNRAAAACATFCPARAYFAVLYAEIDFLRRHAALLHDKELSALLNASSGLIDRMKHFRDGFLHPHDNARRDEAAFEAHELFGRVPGLQFQVDAAVERIRRELRGTVDAIVRQLPEEQSLLCRRASVERAVLAEDLFLEQDSVYLASVRREHHRVLDLESRLRSATPWRPSAHQAAAARKVIEMLVATFQFDPCGDVPVSEPIQPPMDARLYAGFVFSPFAKQAQPRPRLQGRSARHVNTRFCGYLSMMRTAASLENEHLHWGRRRDGTPLGTGEQKSLPWEIARLGAISLVSPAIMAPVLAAYRDVRRENPGASIPGLDAIVDDEKLLPALHELRKEVFHVREPRATSDHAGLPPVLRGDGSSLAQQLIEGLPKFLSWFAPLPADKCA